jgi:LysM repeat protein
LLILNKNIYVINPYFVNINMRKLLIIFILSFVQTLYSQQANTYHVVGSGETLSTIAQKYKLTPYDIIKLNPNAVNGVKEKEVLIIPKSVVPSSTPVPKNNPVQQTSTSSTEKNQGTLLHIVQSKETKFGISKLYGVTIPQLEEQNPQIVAGLQSGHKLKITGATTSYRQDLSKNTSVAFDSKFYYVVLPGETLYGISKRNGLTVDELTKANVSVLNGLLKSGQKITIPTRKGVSGSNVTNTSLAVVSSFSKYHLVEPKETKFGLSKKYGVTIEQLESLNPQIVNGLQIGQKIAVPSSYKGVDEVAPKEIVENNTSIKVEEPKVVVKPAKVNLNQDYVDYEVQPKETLFGLSKKAGMTVSEFTELNPKLATAVQIGMIVKMPKNANVSSNVASNVVVEKVKTVENTIPQPKSTNRYKDLTKTIDKSVKKQLSIILPFDDAKYKEYVAASNGFNDVQDEFLKSNLEFYSGALKAIDSAKTLGLNVDVKIAELQNNAEDTAIDSLVKDGGIDKSNAVLISFYDAKAQKTASALEAQKIPVIANRVSIENKNASNLYVAIPSESEIRLKVLEYLKTNDANIIVVNNTGRKQSKKAINDAFPNAKFVKVSDRDVVDAEDVKELLVKGKLNYVILDTDLNSMIISSTNVLLKESTDFQIQIVVLEPSLLVKYDNVSSIRINILKMIYPSYSSVEQALRISPKSTSNFLMGFDLTLDVMLRLAQNKDFETSINEDVTEYLKYKFQYSKNKEGNTVNNGFYILQHDTDNKIKELK